MADVEKKESEPAVVAEKTASNNDDDAPSLKPDAGQLANENSEAASMELRAEHYLSKVNIAEVLSSEGPIVKCVLLRHMAADGKDAKPHPASATVDETHKRVVLTELIEEIEVDTTPSRGQVKKALGGGPFTFLGQYPTEGTMIVIREQLPDEDELSSLKASQLKKICKEYDIDTSTVVEKKEMVSELMAQQLPVNPHHLQPPFDKVVIRGDILFIRVAETEEVLDDDDNETSPTENCKEEKKEASNVTDDADSKQKEPEESGEFFLDYTKEEYIAFASRTDVVAPELPEVEDEEEADEVDEAAANEEEDEDDDDDADPDYRLVEDDGDEEIEEDEKNAILNLLMAEVLKQFREENGHGPDSMELLQLRGQVAEKLGIEVATIGSIEEAKKKHEQKNGKKRPASGDGGAKVEESPSRKRVKFSSSVPEASTEEAGLPQKMPALEEGSPNNENGESAKAETVAAE